MSALPQGNSQIGRGGHASSTSCAAERPPIELNAAEAMGYKLAILPTLLFRGVIGCCEEFLTELKTGAFPTPPKDLSLHEAFARFRAEEWDSLRDRYRDVSKAVAVARRPEA